MRERERERDLKRHDNFLPLLLLLARFRNETSLVSLRLLDGGHKVQEAIYGHNYTLRAEISRPDGWYTASSRPISYPLRVLIGINERA